jgi:hypothetical protein
MSQGKIMSDDHFIIKPKSGEGYTVVGGSCGLPLSQAQPVPGSKRHKCGKCGCKVWLSPASVRIVRDYHAAVCCTGCYPKDQPPHVTQDTVDEYINYFISRRHRN